MLTTFIRSPGLIQDIDYTSMSSPPSTLLTYTTKCLYGNEDDDAIYLVSLLEHRLNFMSLVDRGADGGICGDDMCPTPLLGRTIGVQGIGNHQLPALAIGTFGATVRRTQQGDVILIFHQHAHHSRGKSIHSSLQSEDNGVAVNPFIMTEAN